MYFFSFAVVNFNFNSTVNMMSYVGTQWITAAVNGAINSIANYAFSRAETQQSPHTKQSEEHPSNKINVDKTLDGIEAKQDAFNNTLHILDDYANNVCCDNNNVQNEEDHCSCLNELNLCIDDIEEKCKGFQSKIHFLLNESALIREKRNKEISEWTKINNMQLKHLCSSYYENLKLWIKIRIEICAKYCISYDHKCAELRKTRDNIVSHITEYKCCHEAVMNAANIKLPLDIHKQQRYEESLSLVVDEWKRKYSQQKYHDITRSMSSKERTCNVTGMLHKILDKSNKTTMTMNVSDGLPYFHPIDNGYQLPFEQILFDPRFEENKIINQFIDNIDQQQLSLVSISTFIYILTNSFLKSCDLTEQLFWDCIHLMVWRAIFPKLKNVVMYITENDTNSVNLDDEYGNQLIWMAKLSQKQIGIDQEFQYSNEGKIAYYAAIKRFKQLSDISRVTPQDSIVWVIDTIHQIQKCAIKYEKISKNETKKTRVIGADSLFPIIVYCLVQSRYDCWHRWIFMMNNFYTDQVLSFGQTGFCFSLIQAAIHYVLTQKPSNFAI